MSGLPSGPARGVPSLLAAGSLAVGGVLLTHSSLKARAARPQGRDGLGAARQSQQGAACGSSSSSRASAAEAPAPSAIDRLFCGGVAGATAKTVVAPLERVKILYQVDPLRKFSLNGAWRTGCSLVAREGAAALWRGHGATLLRVAPYSATMFATFDSYKRVVGEVAPGLGDVGVRFTSGAAAGATATALTYPLDFLRTRMAVLPGGAPSGAPAARGGYWRVVRHLVHTEGPKALWSGARITLLGIVPYSGLSFCIFETLKSHLKDRRRGGGGGTGGEGGLRTCERLGAGALSGLLAQSVTYPLDVVRRRIQVDPPRCRSELEVASGILRSEGCRGLFKGLSINWAKGPFAIAISFWVNDALREHLTGRQS